MTIPFRQSRRVMAVLVAAMLAAPAIAAQGEGQGQGDKAEKRAQKAEKMAEKKAGMRADKQGQHAREDVKAGAFFNDQHREAARAYYSQHYGGGKNCPPGLAKKNNGCLPPGQAKKWAVGEPIPRGVTVYPVPRPVLIQLPPPPYGYRYVRIGNDIMLVQVQNNLIVDIIVGLLG